MRRALLTTALLIAALAATAPPGAAAERLSASVSLMACSFEQHSAAFYARMSNVEGTDRMALRFTLLERTGDEGFRALKAPGLGRWHRSRSGVAALRYRQRVRNLAENATYRMRVDFRWYGPTGDEIARARRRSPRCRQFFSLPNLTAVITRVAPTKVPGVARYELLVSNTGYAAASDVSVHLSVDGAIVDTRELVIGPRQAHPLVIRGPECRARALVEVDPEKLIAETSETDNAHELSCT
jgi:hypothetical protein